MTAKQGDLIHDRNPMDTTGLSAEVQHHLQGYQEWQRPHILEDLPFAMYEAMANYRKYGVGDNPGSAFGAAMYLAAFREMTKE